MIISKYSQLTDKMHYKKADKVCKRGKYMHLGQLKLFFTELLFLTKYASPGDKILYIGAAPGYHTWILAGMFPECNFELWDPRKFARIYRDKPRKNVILYNEMFKNSAARGYKEGSENCLLLCDIRDLDVAGTKNVNDLNSFQIIVGKDMELQLEWCRIIRPKKAYLKFKLPYAGGGNGTSEYLQGTIYLQPYSKISNETRLSTSDYDTMQSYNVLEFEEKMAHHNATTRCSPYNEDVWEDIMKKNNLRSSWDTVYALYVTFSFVKRKYGTGKDADLMQLAVDEYLEIIKIHKEEYILRKISTARFEALFIKNMDS